MPDTKAELLEPPVGVGAELEFALALGFGLAAGAAEEPPPPPQAARIRPVITKPTKDVRLRQRCDEFIKQLRKRDMSLCSSPLWPRFQLFDDDSTVTQRYHSRFRLHQ